ncbi:MAG: hypothetical protein AB9915_00165 [Candidatus Dojkabacteria bacterium]
MKKNTKFKKLLPFILATLILFPILISIFFQNFKIVTILKERPTETVVANISSTSAKIFTKTFPENIYKISYKRVSDSGLFKQADDTKIYTDNISKKKVYLTQLNDLDPNSQYEFRIESENNVWEENFSFSTKQIAEEISLPNIQSGKNNPQSFVLLKSGDENVMVDTQYHGTWAFDNQGKEFTASEYANYTSIHDLQTRLSELMVKPVFAESGANCKTGIEINDSPVPPSKAKVTDIVGRWVSSCLKGGYANECYEDVYCKSLSASVKPAFTFAIWSNESGGSNYANSSNVEDFGIHSGSVAKRNFTSQIDFFLNNIAKNEEYISSCDKTAGYDELSQWGARFLKGDCTSTDNLEAGKQYITSIGTIYNWYTNSSLSWPFTDSSGAECDYSNAYTNSAYNTCSAQGTQTPPSDSEPSDPATPTPTPGGGDGFEDGMLLYNDIRYCTDKDGCQCIYNNYETILHTSNGYYCTPDKKILKTEKVCCQSTEGLAFGWPYDCKGTVIKDVTENNCKASITEFKIEKGINFLEAINVVNKEKVPIDTAKGLIKQSNNKVIAVGLLRNDVWEKIVKYEKGNTNGEDFNLDPGETYLIISTDDVTIPVQGYKSTSTLELNKLKGWNLISSSLLKSSSDSSKSILQNTSFTYINQVAQWQDKQGLFKYTVRDSVNQIFGEDLKISNNQGVFVRIPQ